MGKIKSFRFDLKDKKEVYRPGENIIGSVTIEVEGELKVNTISVFCKGVTLTKWREALQRSYESDRMSYEIYVNLVQKVLTANPPAVLKEGQHTYNFRFRLPAGNIPSSFEGTYGATRYWLKLEVDKPFPSINNTYYKFLTVLAHLDINENNYTKPIQATTKKTLSKVLGFGDAGTLSLTATLDRTGYCPGEKICISLEAKNDSVKDLGLVSASLIQRAEFKAESDNNSTTRIVRTLEGSKVEKGKTVVWKNQYLTVDVLPPSTKALTCHIIKVKYLVKIKVEVPLGLNVEIDIPVTIGTTPLGTPVPAEARLVGNVYVTNNTRAINYKRCIAQGSAFDKSTTGFPMTRTFQPMNAFVPNYDPAQVMAKLLALQNASPSSSGTTSATRSGTGASAQQPLPPQTSLAPKSSTSASGSVQASPAGCTSLNSALNTSQTLPSLQTQTGVAKAAEAFQPPPSVHASMFLEAPPSYEEVCGVPATALVATAPALTPDLAPEVEKGSVLMLLFPGEDLESIGRCFKRNMPTLLLNNGRVQAVIKEMEFFHLHKTAAILIYFPSQKKALGWLQNMLTSNPELTDRWSALVAENRVKLTLDPDSLKYNAASFYLLEKRPDFKSSKSYLDEYNKLLNESVRPLRKKHGAVTVISGAVVFACGDWSSSPVPANQLSLVMSKWPSLENHQAFRQEYESEAVTKRFHELVVQCYTYRNYSVHPTGNIGLFQDF